MEEFSRRTAMLLGADGVERLLQCHVLVVGVGGVGSFAVEALARAGVGALTLCDHDTVAPSNLNRQLIALRSTVGQNKARVAADRIADIHPACRVAAKELFYSEQTRDQIWDGGPYDYVIDAIDTVSAKADLIEQAFQKSIPCISALGTGNKLDPGQFVIADLYQTSVCPLARVMRHEMRKRGVTHHTVLYSTEPPRRPTVSDAPAPGKYTVPGSVSWVPSCAGLMIAGYVIRQLLQMGAEE